MTKDTVVTSEMVPGNSAREILCYLPKRHLETTKVIVALARKQSTMYVMHARLHWNEVNVPADTTGDLWHKRSPKSFGHADASQ